MHLEHLKNNIEKQRYMGGHDLDGSIELPKFQQQHVRIRDGEIQEQSRRRLDDLSEGDLSSIPSYDQLDGNHRGRGPLMQGMSNMPDERTLGEEGQMLFDDNDDDIDMKDLDIDDDNVPHTGRHSRRRELGDDGVHSSYTS
jgi:hypothetical protein